LGHRNLNQVENKDKKVLIMDPVYVRLCTPSCEKNEGVVVILKGV
jgi:hypothetical protein